MSTSTHAFLISAEPTRRRSVLKDGGGGKSQAGMGGREYIFRNKWYFSVRSAVQLHFIYERDKYLLKEVVQEMGPKMAVELTQTDLFLSLSFFFL